jgi:hypothetical protein
LYTTQGDSSFPARWENTITKISFLSLPMLSPAGRVLVKKTRKAGWEDHNLMVSEAGEASNEAIKSIT